MEALLNNCRVATVHEFINCFVILFTITAIIQFSYIRVVLSWCYTKIQTSSELAVPKAPKQPPPYSYPTSNPLLIIYTDRMAWPVNRTWTTIGLTSCFQTKSLSLKYTVAEVSNDTWYQYKQNIYLLIVQTISSPGPFLTARLLMHAFSSFLCLPCSHSFYASAPMKMSLVTKCIRYYYYYYYYYYCYYYYYVYRQILQEIGHKNTWCYMNCR